MLFFLFDGTDPKPRMPRSNDAPVHWYTLRHSRPTQLSLIIPLLCTKAWVVDEEDVEVKCTNSCPGSLKEQTHYLCYEWHLSP